MKLNIEHLKQWIGKTESRSDIPDANVSRFAFRAVKPLFDVAPFQVCGRGIDGKAIQLWAQDADGALAMDATATLT